jgi:predicted site-specific integrase-resolvase
VHQVVKEVGSGINDSRPTFLNLLADPSITLIVVEHTDRATQFGFRSLATLLHHQGRRVEVVNLAENGQGREELVADLVAIVSSFCARLYGQRRAKRTTETSMRHLTSQQSPEEGEREREGVEDAPG